MKRAIGCLAVLMLGNVSGWAGTVTQIVPVNPQDSFLYESSADSNVSAIFINLTGCTGSNAPCISAPAGSTLTLIGLGNECFLPTGGASCTESPAELGGAFDTNSVLLSSSSLSSGNVDRLTGTVNAAGAQDVSNVSFFNTYFGSVNTTIVNDFLIPTGAGITLTVPVGAEYLVVGVFDSYYADNSDPLNNLALSISDTQAPLGVPEPATLGLLFAGLGGLAMIRRYRSR